MNRYLRALVVVPTGALKMGFAKLFHPKSFHGPALCMVSPHSEITLDGGKLTIGSGFKMRDGAKLRVRKGAECVLGKNVSLNSNDMIVCHEKIASAIISSSRRMFTTTMTMTTALRAGLPR